MVNNRQKKEIETLLKEIIALNAQGASEERIEEKTQELVHYLQEEGLALIE